MKRFSFILLTVFALFTFSEEYKFPLSEDKKNFYADVYEEAKFISVSYTHLTLPTNREV